MTAKTKKNIRSYKAIIKAVKETLKYRGYLCKEPCPECGEMLLKNKVGRKWCSNLECSFGLDKKEY